jgi:hypothetical protein
VAIKRLKTLEGPVKLVCARRRREPLRIPTTATHARRSERMFRRDSDPISSHVSSISRRSVPYW